MDVVRAEVCAILGCDRAVVPNIFCGEQPLPFKTSIIYDLLSKYPIADEAMLHDWLGEYMSSREYLEAVIDPISVAYDMDRCVYSEINAQRRNAARRRLAILRPAQSKSTAQKKKRRSSASQDEGSPAYA